MSVEYLNPDGLHQNPAFTNVVVVTGSAKTIYIGGQNGVNASGEIVGQGAASKASFRIRLRFPLVPDSVDATEMNDESV